MARLGNTPSPADLVALTANAEYGNFRYITKWTQDSTEAIAREYRYYCDGGVCPIDGLLTFLTQFQVWRDATTPPQKFIGTAGSGYRDFVDAAAIVDTLPSGTAAYDDYRPWTFGLVSIGSTLGTTLCNLPNAVQFGNLKVYIGSADPNDVWMAVLDSDGWSLLVTPLQRKQFCGGKCLQ